MPDNQTPTTNPLERVLTSIERRANEVIEGVSMVWLLRGVFTDTYFDNVDGRRANELHDGPFGFDSITCRNGAEPTAEQVSDALRAVKRKDPISETSTARAFEGTNPIAEACNIAARPTRPANAR